jgi:hypothetical protein
MCSHHMVLSAPALTSCSKIFLTHSAICFCSKASGPRDIPLYLNLADRADSHIELGVAPLHALCSSRVRREGKADGAGSLLATGLFDGPREHRRHRLDAPRNLCVEIRLRGEIADRLELLLTV